MTRLVPRRPPRERSTDVDGSGVSRVMARLGACSELGCPLATAADAAPIRNLDTPTRRGLFERARFCVFLGSKAGVWRPCRGGIFQRAQNLTKGAKSSARRWAAAASHT